MNTIRVIIFTFFLCQIFSCSKVVEPEFLKISNVKFRDLTMPPDFEMGFTADALFHNANPVGVTVAGMDLAVYVDGKKATQVEQKLSIKVKGNADFTLPLKFRVPLSEKTFIKNLSQMLTGAWKKQMVTIKIDGDIMVKVAGVTVPVAVMDEAEYRFKDYLLK